jgi:hypothetical protein
LERIGKDLDLDLERKEGEGREGEPADGAAPSGEARAPGIKDQGNGNWRDSIDHLRAEVAAGRMTPREARNGLVVFGAQIADVFPLFPDEVAQ